MLSAMVARWSKHGRGDGGAEVVSGGLRPVAA